MCIIRTRSFKFLLLGIVSRPPSIRGLGCLSGTHLTIRHLQYALFWPRVRASIWKLSRTMMQRVSCDAVHLDIHTYTFTFTSVYINVYVYMNMRISIYIYTCMYMYNHLDMYMHIHEGIPRYESCRGRWCRICRATLHIYIYMHMHLNLHLNMSISACVYAHSYFYVYTYMYIHVCIYRYKYAPRCGSYRGRWCRVCRATPCRCAPS